MRVLDPTGKAIATARPVTAVTGAYGPISLTGLGPFRVEACGSVGDRPVCVWGATTNGGTLNLTPLTSAITMLASGQSPETLMTGAVQGLTDAALASAQAQLRTALAPALADAGLASDVDLLAGALTAGSHTGQDRLLDTVAVGLGLDTKAFVTLGSRLGSGTVYLEPGTTQGSLTFDAAAAGLDLPGLGALFSAMTAATAASSSCQPGLNAVFDANVRASIDPGESFAIDLAAQVICLRLGGVLGEGEVMFGGELLPPTLGRCDFSAGDPVCQVSFVYRTYKDKEKKVPLQRRLGIEQAAVKRPTGWRFLGNRLEVQATAAARLVLSRRVDAIAPDSYARYLDIAIPAFSVSGGAALQCARVSQKDTGGADVALALFKRGGGSLLSLWSVSANDGTPSLDPGAGATRGANAVAVPVPGGAAGDTTARNFVRAGRTLKVELYGDVGCTTPFTGADGPAISIELAGLLPIAAAAQSGQPWPVLANASITSLASLKGAVNAAVSYAPGWTFPRGGLAVNRALLCTDAACATKLGELELTAGASSAAFSATLGATALAANAYKLLRIRGRMPDGLVLQLDSQSCAAQTTGLAC